MVNGNNKHPSPIEFIKAWLPIIVLLTGMIMAWTQMDMRIQVLKDEQQKQTLKIDRYAQDTVNILVRLERIETTLDYIRAAVESRNP